MNTDPRQLLLLKLTNKYVDVLEESNRNKQKVDLTHKLRVIDRNNLLVLQQFDTASQEAAINKIQLDSLWDIITSLVTGYDVLYREQIVGAQDTLHWDKEIRRWYLATERKSLSQTIEEHAARIVYDAAIEDVTLMAQDSSKYSDRISNMSFPNGWPIDNLEERKAFKSLLRRVEEYAKKRLSK